jgi:glycine cleavage system H protein
MVALFVLLTIVLLLTIDYFVQRAQLRKAAVLQPAGAAAPQPAAIPLPMAVDRIPKGVFLDPGHTWVQLEPSGALRVGADLFPAAVLGRVDALEVQPAGAHVRRGDPIAVLRRGGRALTLRAPVDGVIQRVNEEARKDPSRLARDPFGGGWLYWITPEAIAPALKTMLVAEEATGWIRRELNRLRDFMSSLALQPAPAGATLHDGGLPAEGLSETLDEASWDRLVDEFFPETR